MFKRVNDRLGAIVQFKLFLTLSLFWFAKAHADFPANSLHREDRLHDHSSDMTKERFVSIIKSIETLYAPVVAQHGANLLIGHNWESPIVNAYADQNRRDWRISLHGGMARRPELTEDGFALAICHEIGHHLGGFSFYGANEWSSAEGQADYFATQACARRLFAGSGSQISEYKQIPQCDALYISDEDRAVCYRTTAAGESLALLIARMEAYPEPQLNTPATRQVPRTYTGHAEPQCRLDTYFSGALCQVPFPLDLIPGKDHPQSQTSAAAQAEALRYSCASGPGSRPRCWFALR